MGNVFSQPKYDAPAVPEAPPPPPPPEKPAPPPQKQQSKENAKQDVLTRRKFEAGRDKTLLNQSGNQGTRKKKTLLGG